MEKYTCFLPDILVVIGIMICLIAPFVIKNPTPKKSSAILNIILLLAVIGFIPSIRYLPIENVYLNGSIYINIFSLFFKFLIVTSALVVGILSYRFTKRLNQKTFEYNALFLFATLGALFLASANDFITLFVSMEIISVSLYFLTAFGDNKFNKEAAVKYFITGTVASALMLFAISFIYAGFGTLNFIHIESLNSSLTKVDPLSVNNLMLNIFETIFFLSFIFKIGAAPFYHWMSDVFEGIELDLGLFISSVIKIAGFAALIRTALAMGKVGSLVNLALIITAVITLLISNMLASRSVKKIGSIKRFLAYSTISNVGYIFLGIAFLMEGTIAASIFYLIVYLIANFGLWTSFMLISLGYSRCDSMNCLKGFGYLEPNFATIFLIFAFSLAGLPLMAGFTGKFYLFFEIFKFGIWALYPMLFVIFASILGLYYYFKIAYLMFQRPECTINHRKRKLFNKFNVFTAAVALFCVLIFGAFFASGMLIRFCNYLI